MIGLILEKLRELGKDPNDRECPVANSVCPYRVNQKCKYSRFERAVLMLDCAYE
jgi:hypothetical protein